MRTASEASTRRRSTGTRSSPNWRRKHGPQMRGSRRSLVTARLWPMKKWGSIVAAAVIVVGLAGCTSGVTQSFDSVTKLKDAYLAAGGVCDGWNQDNHVTKARQSGTCGD